MNGPAIGRKEWMLNGKRHRVGGPAVEYTDGSKDWYINGLRHRLDGPAIEGCDIEEWFQNGKRHRVDGPAIFGQKTELWYINGKPIDIFSILERLDVSSDWQSWTEEEKFLVRLALP